MKIEGLDKLVSDVQGAGKELNGLLFQTMTKATTWVQEDAKRISPGSFKNQTGNLRRNIWRRVESAARGVIGVGEKYGAYVEFGTKPHIITPKKARVLKFKSGGKTIFARKINHPGSRPYPFMEPAFKDNLNRITSEYTNVAAHIVNTMAGK